jgi:sigma-B regulation protein RsbU (phosphoserine phosphatase)
MEMQGVLVMPISANKGLMYQVLDNLKSMIRIIDEDNNMIYMNKKMRDQFGDKTGKKCYTLFHHGEKCEECIGCKSIETNSDQTREIEYKGKHYRVIASPAKLTRSGLYSIEFFQDITEQKKLEREFMEHYEKLKGDIEFAKQMQVKALPDDGIYWNSLKLNSAYLPSEDLGGDIFDIVRIDRDNCIFYIADVSGHGVRSSLLTMFLRQVIRGLKPNAAEPIAFIEEMIKGYHNLNLDNENYISVLCGIYNIKTRGLSLINAGHNCPPIVLDANRKKATEIVIKGMPICSLLKRPNHQVRIVQMEKGDKILLYTDGVSEAFNNKDDKSFGIEGIKKVLLECGNDNETIVNKLINKAKKFAGGTPTDDMAVVMLEIL